MVPRLFLIARCVKKDGFAFSLFSCLIYNQKRSDIKKNSLKIITMTTIRSKEEFLFQSVDGFVDFVSSFLFSSLYRDKK